VSSEESSHWAAGFHSSFCFSVMVCLICDMGTGVQVEDRASLSLAAGCMVFLSVAYSRSRNINTDTIDYRFCCDTARISFLAISELHSSVSKFTSPVSLYVEDHRLNDSTA
jgi:hypothetical protein